MILAAWEAGGSFVHLAKELAGDPMAIEAIPSTEIPVCQKAAAAEPRIVLYRFAGLPIQLAAFRPRVGPDGSDVQLAMRPRTAGDLAPALAVIESISRDD